MSDIYILNEMSKVDTPTMCNALESVMGTRTAVGFTKKQVVSADPKLNSIVGFARTAKIRAASPPLLSPEKVQEKPKKKRKGPPKGGSFGPTVGGF